MAKKESKGLGLGAIIGIFLLVLILLPAGVGAGFYFLNTPFQEQANEVLSEMPGPIGSYFEKFPTRAELNAQILEISNFLLDMDVARAIDKLMLIKAEDQNLYDEIIKSMLRIDPNSAKDIVEKIREMNLRDTAVSTTLAIIDEEKSSEYVTKAGLLDEMKTSEVLAEFDEIIATEFTPYKTIANILVNMTPENAALALRYMSVEEKAEIYKTMSSSDEKMYEEMIQEYVSNEREQIILADLYRTESPEKLAQTLGANATAATSDLAIIYANLGVVTAGEVLSIVDNDEFTYNLLDEIKEYQTLTYGEDKISKDMLNSLKIFKTFDDNVTELVNIYAKMDTGDIATIVTRFYRNTTNPKEYTLNNGEVISYSDQDLALALMNRFSEKTKAEVLSEMDTVTSSEISKRLLLPNE